MTLRERIADWLTGGEYFAVLGIAKAATDEMVKKHSLAISYADALRAISAEAKRGKNPNATVRRMGKMADEAAG